MKLTQRILTLVAAACLWASVARGADPLTLTLSATNFSGYQIPMDFSGLSWEIADQYPNGWQVSGDSFDPTNVEMLTLWQQMALHNLRIGAGTVDNTNFSLPRNVDIDRLFGFADVAGMKVIYDGLRLLNGNANTDAITAQYVWQNYSPLVDQFSIGNEPDAYGGSWTYSFYLSTWNSFYSTISAQASGAYFAGPDAIYDGSSDWASQFANSQKSSGRAINLITHHEYWGGSPTGVTATMAVSNMLSTAWLSSLYPSALSSISAVISDGYSYRWTEMDDYLGGIEGASDGFASALWALDCLHWWAANGNNKCVGINFHNNMWIATDTLYPGPIVGGWHQGWFIHPKGYGIKAWDLGGHGYVMPVTISNPNGANDTAYAVGNAQDLYVTIVNKNPNANATTAACTLVPNGFLSASVSAMYLTSASGNLQATNDTSLGGANITNNAQWAGYWTPLTPDTNGNVLVNVSPHQAAIVRLHAGCNYVGPIQPNINSLLEIFTIGTNGDVFHRWQNYSASAPTNWAGAYNDLGVLASGVTASSTPTIIKNLDGTLQVFVSGSDGNIYTIYQLAPRSTWSAWSSMGGLGVTNLQAELNPDGSMNLFGIGTNGDIWNISEIAPGLSSGLWNDMGTPSGAAIQPGFAVAQNLDGRLEIFGVDASGSLWHKYQKNGSSYGIWSGWNSLSGATVNPRLQLARNSYGYIYVFGIDTSSGGIDYIDQVTNGWSSWDTTDLGAPSGLTVEPGFVAGQDCDGRFEILAGCSDSNVYHKYINASHVWSNWSSLGGSGSDPQLVIGNTPNGSLQVFGIDTANNDVWSIWQTVPAGGWNSWTDFGGNGQKFYPGQP